MIILSYLILLAIYGTNKIAHIIHNSLPKLCSSYTLYKIALRYLFKTAQAYAVTTKILIDSELF